MASPPVSTTVTELPESRVRVQAEVPSDEVERRVAQAARSLGRNLRVPGFRAGKAPPPVVIQRVGRDAVLDEAVRGSIGSWYTAAIDAARIVPVGEPDVDLGDLPRAGEPLRFSIEIGVRPQARLGEYKGLDVPRREPEVSDEEIDEQASQLRERSARLNSVERPLQDGDFVVMDFLGTIDGEPFGGGEGRDQLVNPDDFIAGFKDQLLGAVAGEERTVKVRFPDDYRATDLAGQDAEFAVTVKDVKERELPSDDDFAAEAGFDTLDELRADIRERVSERRRAEIEAEFREAALDAAVANATVDLPDALVEARARELWESMLHQLAHQGITREAYLQISGRSEDEIVADGKADAEQALRREAVLAAVIEAEGIAPTDDEVLEAASPDEKPTKKQLARLKESGNLDRLRERVAEQRALDLVAESANAVAA
jgi:trigger factor